MKQTTEAASSQKAEAKISPWDSLLRLLRLSKPFTGRYIFLCFISIILSLATVGLAEALRLIINAATERDMSQLSSGLVFALGIVVTLALGSFIKTYATGQLEYKSVARLQKLLLSKLLRTRMNHVDQYHTADVISRINDSAVAAQSGINNKIIDMIGNVMQILFLMIYLLSLEYLLTLGTVLISLSVPLIIAPLGRKLRILHQDRQKAAAAQQSLVQDAVQGAETVRAFSLASVLSEKFSKGTAAYFRIHIPLTRLEAVTNIIPLAVILGGILYVLSFGGYLVINGRLDVGAIAAFLICFEQISLPASRLAALWTDLQSSLAQGNRVFELLDLEEESSEPDAPVSGNPGASGTDILGIPGSPGASIALQGVCFGYKQDQPVLNNISMLIREGEVTALTGASGSGKSTIINLLLAAYEPDQGSIYCGHTALGDIPVRSWRSSIAYVSQAPYLFSGTLFENIAWGKEGAAYEEVVRAAQLAGIHEFIQSTPDQYESVIGEGGLTLSGGERQRLSIARAFIRQPRLLLLDEPTSALDSHNEELVQHALKQLMHGRTCVVIAHRLSTIREADYIYYLESGRIAEEGTHGQLMAASGKYQTMFMANQSAGSQEAITAREAEV